MEIVSSIAVPFVLVLILTLISIADIKTLTIPTLLNFLLLCLGLGDAALDSSDRLIHCLIGMVGGYFLLRVTSDVFRFIKGNSGLGEGDAYLLAAGGAWVGWEHLSAVVLIASSVTLAASTLSGKLIAPLKAIPFAPGLCIGILTMWLLEQHTKWT